MVNRLPLKLHRDPLCCWMAVLLLSFTLTGCGLKTYPRPVAPDQLPQIQDLTTQVRGKTVEVSWTIPSPLSQPESDPGIRFVVLKSEIQWDNRNCLECPTPMQQEILLIDPRRPSPAVQSGQTVTWTDTVVSHNRAYRYQIVIRDSAKREMTRSNPVLAKVVPAPSQLKNVTATTEPRGIALQWKMPKRSEAGKAEASDLQVVVERHTAEGGWVKLTSLPIKGSTFVDSSVASNQLYDYRVIPVYAFEDTLIFGEGVTLPQVKAPEALPPPPPGTVWVIPVKGGLEVHWLKSEGKVGGYHVYRQEGKEIIRLTATPVQNPPFIDKSVRKNVVYCYAVSAVNTQSDQREGLLSKWAEIRSLLID
jgi:hypothetical protein